MDQCQNERSLHLARRQQCACLIQEIGSRLQTTQVVINAGIYYMHNFYEVFSPETIKPILVAIAALYCACKTEDFSRKLSYLIRAAYSILRKTVPNESSDTFKRLVQNIHALEATILMVIGFQKLEAKQPHVLLIKTIRANKFPKEIAHSSYYICTNILHLTTIILRHSVEAVAAASLYIAAKWNGTDIQSSNGEWYHIFSPTLTLDEIMKITDEFTLTFQECDLKIREQLRTSLRSRKLQREQRDETVVNSTSNITDPQRKNADPIYQMKPDSWKSEKRPYVNSGSNVNPNPSHPSNHHPRSHPNNSQNPTQNHPYHSAGRPGPPHQSHNVNNNNNMDHFNRPHINNRGQPAITGEPESKRQRFDRPFSSQGRHSPQSHTQSMHHDSGSRMNRHEASGVSDSSMRYGGGGGAPGRSHGSDYRMVPSSGYNSVPNKNAGGRDERANSRPPGNSNRPPIKPVGHPQSNCRPMQQKHDLNDYF